MRSWLKERREKAGITTAEMAERLFISDGYYQAIEAGEAQKKMDSIFIGQLSVILNTSPANIIAWEAV